MATVSDSEAVGSSTRNSIYNCTVIIMLSRRLCSFADGRRMARRRRPALRCVPSAEIDLRNERAREDHQLTDRDRSRPVGKLN